MNISSEDWKKYIKKMSGLCDTASSMIAEYITKNGLDDDRLLDYALAVATKYGEGSAALASAMYEAIAEEQGQIVPTPETAETPDMHEIARTINGTKKFSQNAKVIGDAVGRLVKRTGADTMLINAKRDGAEFAWIPSGDTCAFCIMLASRGWQHISQNTLKNGHAEHIHAHCDCNYAVRFDGKMKVEGYDPKIYRQQYESAEGNTPEEKIRYMRRERDAEKNRRIILSEKSVNDVTPNRNLKIRKDENRKEEVYISENAIIKPKELHNIVSDIKESMQLLGKEKERIPRIVIVSKEENIDILASYNCVNNTIYIIPEAGNRDLIKQFQKGLAEEDNPMSTALHEMWHWQQAERFKQGHGEINESNYVAYNIWLRNKAKAHLDKAGITMDNVKRISKRAEIDYLNGKFDEVEAEFQVTVLLKGTIR